MVAAGFRCLAAIALAVHGALNYPILCTLHDVYIDSNCIVCVFVNGFVRKGDE